MRSVMMICGSFLGLLCGIGVAVVVEMSDESVRHAGEAAQIFGKPVLAGIPKITSDQERIRARWRMASMTAGTAIAAIAFGLVISRFVS
jgi:energy-converting hydrogenase Eha subunit A